MLRLEGDVPPPDRQCVFTTLRVDHGSPVHWGRHRSRLARSCALLYRRQLPSGLDQRVGAACGQAPAAGRLRVRLRCEEGQAELDLAVEVSTAVAAATAPRHLVTVAGRDGDWSHKWCDRRQLAAAERLVGPAGVPVFVGPDGDVLETSTANLLATDGTALRTPPLTGGVLPGVTRELVLAAARDVGLVVREEPLRPSDLAGLVVWTASSIRGLVPTASLDGRPLPQDAVLLDGVRRAVGALRH